jgi:ubiquinone/menaquinone biosynthesis C-methylase UbiE
MGNIEMKLTTDKSELHQLLISSHKTILPGVGTYGIGTYGIGTYGIGTTHSSAEDPIVSSFETWTSGIQSEIDFWNAWVKDQGLTWPEDFKQRLDPKTLIVPWLMNLATQATQNKQEKFSVLDVGSGPITLLGHKSSHPEVQIAITAVDPLAKAYQAIFYKFGLTSPNVTQFAAAEYLSYFFDEQFDLVHCCNALDHAIDPVAGILEMLKVVKVGGSVILNHHANEAVTQSYGGLHQHNFDVKDGDFIIWNKNGSVYLKNCIPIKNTFTATKIDNYTCLTIVKLEEFETNEFSSEKEKLDIREKLQELIEKTWFSGTGI